MVNFLNKDLQAKYEEMHTPLSHKKHTKTCGCALDMLDSSLKIVCPNCGATYLWMEVVTFLVWTCYDCGWRYYDIRAKREGNG